MKPADSYAIAALMTQLEGWKRSDRLSSLPIYGRQRVYVRQAKDPEFPDESQSERTYKLSIINTNDVYL